MTPAEGEEEAKKEETEAAAEEVKAEEPKEEEEDEEALPGIDFADYEAKRLQERQTGNLKVKQTREHVENPKERVLEQTIEDQRVVAGVSKVSGAAVYASRPGAGAELFGFQGAKDEEEEFQGGRGGRGGRRGGRDAGQGRGADRRPPQKQGGGRKGGKVVTLNENDFPTL